MGVRGEVGRGREVQLNILATTFSTPLVKSMKISNF